jgi:hypothetical protein
MTRGDILDQAKALVTGQRADVVTEWGVLDGGGVLGPLNGAFDMTPEQRARQMAKRFGGHVVTRTVTTTPWQPPEP